MSTTANVVIAYTKREAQKVENGLYQQEKQEVLVGVIINGEKKVSPIRMQ